MVVINTWVNVMAGKLQANIFTGKTRLFWELEVRKTQSWVISHRIKVWYIYLYLVDFFMVNVHKYIDIPYSSILWSYGVALKKTNVFGYQTTSLCSQVAQGCTTCKTYEVPSNATEPHQLDWVAARMRMSCTPCSWTKALQKGPS